MTRIKTYNTVPGTNFIEGTELALTTIYEVRREGLQYDLFFTGSTSNRTYVYDRPNGRVYFNNVFNSGERVYVIYKETSAVVTPIPGVCIPVVIPATTLPNAVIDIPYSVAITLAGTAPFLLANPVIPVWMSLTISGNNVYLTGTSTVEANETVSFDVTNCIGATDSFSGAFDVIAAPITFTVTNQSSGVITKIIPGFFTIVTGSFPISNAQSLTGVHPAFTGGFSVFINGLVFPSTLSLVRNGSLLESIPVFLDDAYTFADQTFLSADIIDINLN